MSHARVAAGGGVVVIVMVVLLVIVAMVEIVFVSVWIEVMVLMSVVVICENGYWCMWI